MPSGGGAPEIVTEVDIAAGDPRHAWFDVLPGGSAVYTVFTEIPTIQSVDLETGEVKDLTAGRYPRYSNTGHLLFQDATETTLLAAPSDISPQSGLAPNRVDRSRDLDPSHPPAKVDLRDL